ncbi:dGTP triphosphohydrolase [Mucilaginibacter gilvus]|uniref:DNTP triphosphohydrolase n=1 Tax=Mucilaginibacter gilvus TaxID=2305909 RepID=A0A444MPW6_9SPHI|nr:dNTP triphosphohydrolase [Mucilaginibacter gilvus]RWY53665.1 dNTP triphosphohydrolase [Mucilaginibacter gilvus]
MNWKKYLNANRLRTSDRERELDPRNEFESDFGRVIFSPATRRMHDKTQVFPLTSDDNIHSRLTHSLEVMSIGHSLGLNICQNSEFIKSLGLDQRDLIREIPIILKNACLVHDIGNPPFGHFGETVIQTYFEKLFKTESFGLNEIEREDFTLFDGNAQGFRVLTKLQMLEDIYGLNLTYASLAAYIKYPNTGKIDKKFLYQKKRGVFQSEKNYLEEIADGCGLYKNTKIIRHPLAYLMEAADSICYLVMDIEDGFNKSLYTYDFIKSKLVGLQGMTEQFLKLESKYQTPLGRVVNLRIYLIKRLVDLSVSNFMKNITIICEGKYNHELIHDDEFKLADTLQDFCVNEIFPKREVQSLELTGHSVLSGLLDYYIKFTFHESKDYRKRAVGLISESVKKVAYKEYGVSNFDSLNKYYKLRVIVDFISGMTDQYALNHFQKLSGQKIN